MYVKKKIMNIINLFSAYYRSRSKLNHAHKSYRTLNGTILYHDNIYKLKKMTMSPLARLYYQVPLTAQ